ncbi:MAG: FKBP-type peptidyl-prolyl cis-trans isomerase [Flavisolibacter sp.]
MKSVKLFFSILSMTLLFAACETKIDFKKTAGGVPYKIFPAKKGKDTIAVNDIIKYHRIVKIKDSVLNNTYLEVPAYEKVRLATTSYGDPLPEILTRAKEGDSIYYVQAMDSFIFHNPQIEQETPFRKGDQLITTIRVLKVFKNEEEARAEFMKDNEKAMQANYKKIEAAEAQSLEAFKKDSASQNQIAKDNKVIEAYLQKNNIQAQKTDWGVYIQVLNPGQGPKPAVGKYASVNYKGSLLSGETFDAGVYPLQIGTGGSIKGFEEGVRQLAKGGRARVFIPSVLGYGAMGSGDKIKANANLIFDLEILDITDTPPQQGAQPADTSHAGHNH